MNNSYLSNEPTKYVRQKYLRMDIFNYETLAFRDYSVIAESEIYEDIYVSQQSTFIIPNKYHYLAVKGYKKEKLKIQFEQGDIVRVKNEEGKLVFQGVILSIEDFEPVESAKIICKPIVSILDTKLIYNGFPEETVVAEEMKSLLLKNLKGEQVKAIPENYKFNRKYIKVEIDEEVKKIKGSIPFEKPKEIILWDFFRTLYDNFELYLDFSMEFNDGNTRNYLIIKITKNKKNEPERLKNNFADLQNLVVDDLYKQTPNRLDIYKEDGNGGLEIDQTWVLIKRYDEEYKKNKSFAVNLKNIKETDEMFYPVVTKTVAKTEIIKNEDDEANKNDKYTEYANAQLKGNTYSHMVEFDLVRTTKIIDVSTMKLYDRFILYINGRVYETVLSGIKQNYERSNLTRFIFGKARIHINDKLKLSNIFEK